VLATVDRDEITLWNVSERTPITSFTEDGSLTGIAIAPDNRTVALAIDDPGDNDRITLWDATQRVRFAALPLRSSMAGMVAFHANGTKVAATDRDVVRFWDLDPNRVTTRICATLDRGLTREQWSEFIPERPYRATCD
jgi:hypothetical protein